MKPSVTKVFIAWVKFMNDNGPMGKNKGHLSTDQFKHLRELIKAELAKLDEDDANFNYGAMS